MANMSPTNMLHIAKPLSERPQTVKRRYIMGRMRTQNPVTRRVAIVGPILAILILLIGALMLRNMGDTPIPAPTARPPAEPASIYLGPLADGQGIVGLVVGQARVRAAVCSLDDSHWQTLSRWLGQGTVQSSEGKTLISAQNAADSAERYHLTAQADGTTPSDVLAGTYHAPDGTDHTFVARRLSAGAREGIYRLDGARLPNGQGTALLITLLTRVTDTNDADLCGFLIQNDKTISRVALKDIWQGGFSSFVLLDMRDKDDKAMIMLAPGILGQIDSIALPTPTP